ncbi:conserved hypothetical protein, partial [Mycobacterium tuberculosis variant africanum K85]
LRRLRRRRRIRLPDGGQRRPRGQRRHGLRLRRRRRQRRSWPGLRRRDRWGWRHPRADR